MKQHEFEQLKAFVRAVIKTRCWGWDGEEDGGTIQDLAERHGLIEPFVISEKQATDGYVEGGEAGDIAYDFAPWMKEQS